jgi:hypothetical protein
MENSSTTFKPDEPRRGNITGQVAAVVRSTFAHPSNPKSRPNSKIRSCKQDPLQHQNMRINNGVKWLAGDALGR